MTALGAEGRLEELRGETLVSPPDAHADATSASDGDCARCCSEEASEELLSRMPPLMAWALRDKRTRASSIRRVHVTHGRSGLAAEIVAYPRKPSPTRRSFLPFLVGISKRNVTV